MQAVASKERTVRIFTGAASAYDSVIPWFAHFGRVLVDAAQPRPGEQLLDVATGRGAVLLPALRHLGDTGFGVGIDLTPRMVSLTRKDIARKGRDRAGLLRADAEALPFSHCSFDLVTCGHALNFFPNPERALAEMMRVIRPRGRIAISLLDKPNAELDFFPEMAMKMLPPDRLHSAVPASKLDGTARRVFDAGSYLRGAGFDYVQTSTSAADFILPDEEAWWRWLQTHGDRLFFQLLSNRELRVLKRECFDRLRPKRGSDGYILHDRMQLAIGWRAD
jgi:ubiquinone/menaquinone biosynthesis C-methylase UbiE